MLCALRPIGASDRDPKKPLDRWVISGLVFATISRGGVIPSDPTSCLYSGQVQRILRCCMCLWVANGTSDPSGEQRCGLGHYGPTFSPSWGASYPLAFPRENYNGFRHFGASPAGMGDALDEHHRCGTSHRVIETPATHHARRRGFTSKGLIRSGLDYRDQKQGTSRAAAVHKELIRRLSLRWWL